jgi:HEPN domain-containing protein
VNRTDLQQLAESRLEDARVLFQQGGFAAAYYLCGYAVECGLKACIARQILQHEYPPRRTFSAELFSHKFKELVPLARLSPALVIERQRNKQFAANWSEVEKWSEDSRYENWTMQDSLLPLAAFLTEELERHGTIIDVAAWIQDEDSGEWELLV